MHLHCTLHVIAFVAILWTALTTGQKCPSKCLCFRSTVRCMFLQLDQVPVVPKETAIFDLRFNKIKSIPENTFKNLPNLSTLLLNNNHITQLHNGSFNGLMGLRYLYLYKNRIRTIDSHTFHGLKNLEQLYLHFNDLTSVEPETFTDLPVIERLFLHNNRLQRVPYGTFDTLKTLKRLRLDSNALICDCQLMWLAQMANEMRSHTQVAATCQYPDDMQGKSLTSLQESDFHCEGLPNIMKGPSDLEIKFGMTAFFSCKVQGDPQPDVVWLHNNEVVLEDPRRRVKDDGTLMIENTQDEDVGFYECRATSPMGEVRSHKAHMTHQQTEAEDPFIQRLNSVHGDTDSTVPEITAKPRLLRIPSDISVAEGSPVDFECEAAGSPSPTISWSLDDSPLINSNHVLISKTGHLTIPVTSREDEGVFQCTVTNSMGSVTATAMLKIFVRPIFTEIPIDQYTNEGSSVEFTCTADGLPVPAIFWSREGEPLPQSTRITVTLGGRRVRIVDVKTSDEGEYVCRAQNAVGVKEMAAYLYVRDKVPPIIRKEPHDVTVTSGEDITLVCKVEGLPRPVIVWRRNGEDLLPDDKHRIESDGSLNMKNVNRQDAGLYECSAQNSAGFVSARATVTVRQDFPNQHRGDQFLQDSFVEAKHQVNKAINDTINQLFRQNRESVPLPHELVRIFRYPTNEAREIARASEMMEHTLHIVKKRVESGIHLNQTDYLYEDLLSPDKIALLTDLSGCLGHRRIATCDDICLHSKYRTIDGTCNNFDNPMWGSSLTGFRRMLSPIYENGFNLPVGWSKSKKYFGHLKPSARLVSTRLISTESITPDEVVTHMLMQWGQFLDHDLDHAIPSVSTESFLNGANCHRTCDNAAPCFPIEVPPEDPRIYGERKCITFFRTSAICGSGVTSVFFNKISQREQINQLTSFIDASQVYGSSAEEMRLLRNWTHQTGELKTGQNTPYGKPLMPFSSGAPVDCRRDISESTVDCFLAGDIRSNEQLALTAMHTIWFREHNRIAKAFNKINPLWDSETIFQEARKIVGAEMQHITFSHWLPHVLGPQGMKMLDEYKGYNPNLEPTVSNVFATAALRFGHTLINPILHRLNASFQTIPEGHLPLHRAFFSPWRIVHEGGIDPLLRGLFINPAKLKKAGQFLNTELTEKLFRAAHFVALDLAALNIQRGRDHGLPGYMEWRKLCNLSVSDNFDNVEDISSSQLREILKEVYGHPGNVDAWVGMVLEDSVEGARVGPTFMCILLDQFKRLRDADRFWYENPSVFKPEQLEQIKQVTLSTVLCDNGDAIDNVTADVFLLPRHQNPQFVPCSTLPKVNLRMWGECCTGCQNSGNFNSLLQTSGIRFRRHAKFSYSEDRDHFLNGRQDGELSLDSNIEDSNSLHGKINATDHIMNNRPTVNDEAQDRLSKNRNDKFENDDTDLIEERIEGIEALVEKLSKTVNSLHKKVAKMERNFRLRRRKVNCIDNEGNKRELGETWFIDQCTNCSCKKNGVQCQVIVCPPVSCQDPITLPNQCCRIC